MDQHAFRQLISTPRSDVPQQSSSSSPSSRYFGKQNKRVVKDNNDALNSSDLLPRKIRGEQSKKASGSSLKEKPVAVNSSTGESYIDRAEARRLGRQDEDDSSDVDSTIKDAAQIKKGLDMALLAQQKAKLSSRDGNHGLEVDDDDLENVYSSSKSSEVNKPKEDKSNAKPSKFKPIGASIVVESVGVEQGGPPEYIWRDGKRMRKKKKEKKKGDDTVVDSKLREVVEEVSSNASVPATANKKKPIEELNAIGKSKKQQEESEEERAVMPPPCIVPSVKGKEVVSKGDEQEAKEPVLKSDKEHQNMSSDSEDANDSDDEAADIFADAGRWNGLEDDEDDEEGEDGEVVSDDKTKAPMTSVLPPSGKRDWFSTGKETAEDNTDEGKVSDTLSPDLSNLLKTVNEAKKSLEVRENKSPDSEEDDEEGSQTKHVETSTRLEGFSDSILGREGVRYMLEKKDDEGGHQKRKRKRSKKGKGGYGSD